MFSGVGTALVTPFCEKTGKINFESLENLLKEQVKSGVDFIVLLGTTGEASTISMNEKIEIISFVKKFLGKKIPLVVGAGSNSTLQAIENVKTFEKLGVDGFLIVSPYYNKSTQKGLVSHYLSIASETCLPIILYNVPSRTGVNISPQTVFELSKIKNIVGIKEASGNLSQIQEIIRICSNDFVVLSGDDELTLPILSLGGKGVISVVSNLFPMLMKKLVSEFFRGDISVSQKLQLELQPLIKALFSEVNPIPIKNAMNYLNKNVGGLRLPLISEMEKENQQKLIVEIDRLKNKYVS